MKSNTDNEILNIKEAAEYLKIGGRGVRNLIKSGDIPHKLVLNKYRFVKDDLRKWVQGE